MKILFQTLVVFFSISIYAQGQNTIQIGNTTLTERSLLTGLGIAWDIVWGPDDHIWFTEREVISSIQFINQQNKSRYLTKNKLFTIEDSQYINFFIVKDILKSGNIPPISYLYDRIKSTIINQRKLQLLQSLNKEILNDALKSRKYEIFK